MTWTVRGALVVGRPFGSQATAVSVRGPGVTREASAMKRKRSTGSPCDIRTWVGRILSPVES
jgi:hypothetical protein